MLVTGANSGLGFWTSVELARHGARVLMGCRDPQRAEAALERLRREAPGALAELVSLDLADLSSVEDAAAEVTRRTDSLDVLACNAGIMGVPKGTTADGLERQLGTNHLGHVALTGRLLPLLLADPAGRLVVTSSEGHRIGKIDFDDLMGERRYRRWGAYGQSKLANLLFVRELARRAGGTALVVAAAHPGYAATNLQSGQGSRVLEALMAVGNRIFAQSDAAGAWPQEYAATMPGVQPDDYHGPSGVGGTRGSPDKVGRSRRARSDDDARRLWEVSQDLTGVAYDALPPVEAAA